VVNLGFEETKHATGRELLHLYGTAGAPEPQGEAAAPPALRWLEDVAAKVALIQTLIPSAPGAVEEMLPKEVALLAGPVMRSRMGRPGRPVQAAVEERWAARASVPNFLPMWAMLEGHPSLHAQILPGQTSVRQDGGGLECPDDPAFVHDVCLPRAAVTT
jgi:hypothetical protein